MMFFCAEIKSNIKTSHIPIILLTAVVDENKKNFGLKKGADDGKNCTITKPTTAATYSKKKKRKYNSYDEELLQTIDTYLNQNLNNIELTIEELVHEIGLR